MTEPDAPYQVDPETCEECRIARALQRGVWCPFHRAEARRKDEEEKQEREARAAQQEQGEAEALYDLSRRDV